MKKCFLNEDLNDSIEEQLRMKWGRLFHMQGAGTEKPFSPHDQERRVLFTEHTEKRPRHVIKVKLVHIDMEPFTTGYVRSTSLY